MGNWDAVCTTTNGGCVAGYWRYAPLTQFCQTHDRWIWRHTANGAFTSRSAYLALTKTDEVDNPLTWSWLWKIPVPSRWQHFLWLVRKA